MARSLGLALIVGLAACEQGAVPTPTAIAPAAAAAGAGATLEVTVLTYNGLPAPGLLVVPFNTATGPFQNGAYTSATTNSTGLATFSALASGSYCVTVRSLPQEAVGNLNSGLIPPPNAPAGYTGPTNNSGGLVGVVTGANLATAPLTKSSFTTYCTTSAAPLALKSGKKQLTITLLNPTATPPGSVAWSLLGLTGGTASVGAWTVLDLPLPWFPGTLPPDVRPGLLVATSNASTNAAGGLSTADEVVVQTALFQGAPGQGLLTGTLHKVPQTGTPTASAIFVEPLVCQVNKDPELFGDATGPVDLGGIGSNSVIRLGFGATQALALDGSTFSVWHLARLAAGTTSASLTLNIRFLGGPVANMSQDFNWNGTSWVLGATRGSSGGNVTVTPFAAPVGGDWRITWVVTGVDPAVTAVDLQIGTNGDKWPDASRSDNVAGYYRLYEPASSAACQGGQGSDDRYWVN